MAVEAIVTELDVIIIDNKGMCLLSSTGMGVVSFVEGHGI
jgi:hypothetical protein